jgi:acetyl/propionyl-CoA carboxylase alpha subunit
VSHDPEDRTETVVRKILIANRGEIARRIQRSCREMGVRTVAVFSEVDADAPFVHEADEAFALGGRSAAESYLRIDAIVGAARSTGADAVHPGYGFLAENADFARACEEAGLIFLGPTPATIEAMGSKVRAREMMIAAGVPVAPAMTLDGASEEETASIPDRLGLPLMIKASAGGGGKGMRVVRHAEDFAAALAGARSEALSTFGDDTVFVERYVEQARHIEVQIIGDVHGDVRHLFERECSIQRRHQKIIEEAPSMVMSPGLRDRFTQVAVDAGNALHYRGVGTVEFLYAEATDEIFFLEINTRLQVEHPVTEAITGLDLVAAQIAVAERTDLSEVIGEPQITGHAVEVRLYAEDAATGFLPATGTLERFRIPVLPGIRVDPGPVAGDAVTADYDPMIAKVIAHAATRAQAIRTLAAALRDAEIHGLTTNRDFLVRLLEHPDFVAGRFDTQFLDTPAAASLTVALVDDAGQLRLAAAAAALALQACQRAGVVNGRSLPSGWRNNRSTLQRRTVRHGDQDFAVGYRLDPDEITVDGVRLHGCRVYDAREDRVDLQVDGRRMTLRVAIYGEDVYVNLPTGQLLFRAQPRFPGAEDEQAPGSLTSPVPGKVIRLACAVGEVVVAGDVVLVIEAMKMQHEIVAPAAGAVTQLLVDEGAQVDAGAVVAVIADPETEDL